MKNGHVVSPKKKHAQIGKTVSYSDPYRATRATVWALNSMVTSIGKDTTSLCPVAVVTAFGCAGNSMVHS